MNFLKVLILALIPIVFISCKDQEAEKAKVDNSKHVKTIDSLKSVLTSYTAKRNIVNWFEIPVKDYERAHKFYSHVLQLEIKTMEIEGITMGSFPFEGFNNSGAIVQGEFFIPSTNGIIIYFECDGDLQNYLDRVEPAGGKIAVPKTQIDTEHGFFAFFMDNEGNKIGLHSME